jgi:GNAT superfamily N-acetyltransferase
MRDNPSGVYAAVEVTVSFQPTEIPHTRLLYARSATSTRRDTARRVSKGLCTHTYSECPHRQPAINSGLDLRELDPAAVQLLTSLRGGRTLVTLAPEMTTPAMIRRPAGAGVVVSAAYTNATYEQIPGQQRHGVGAALLETLRSRSTRRMLVGTWAAAVWAISFYHRHGFELVAPERKKPLLETYWTVPNRQIEASVVLANPPLDGA